MSFNEVDRAQVLAEALPYIQKYYGNEGNITKALKILVFLWKPENFSELWVRPVLERQRC